MKKFLLTIAIAAAATAGGLVAAPKPADALSSRYGCYVVTAGALNIRERAWSKSKVVGVARKGDKLAKRRRFCALRGFWCPVSKQDGVDGWADKRHLDRTPC
jgi:hypothetical protein